MSFYIYVIQYRSLSAEDFKNGKINSTETPVVVTGNRERHKFIAEKIETFGRKRKQPILRWLCRVRVGYNEYKKPEFNPENVYDELIKYFVRGAKCVLTENLETRLGLGKGTEGTYVDVVWKDKKNAVDLDTLPIGEIKTVNMPDYIVIQIKEKENEKETIKFFALEVTKGTFKDD
ncbi:MAG: hypothetical protein GY928_34570, partial [Colwellia sp.]|nr:hypothetical protein [Colwellia sp.]